MAPTQQRCRFYKPKYPEVDDVVMVTVRSIAGQSSLFLATP